MSTSLLHFLTIIIVAWLTAQCKAIEKGEDICSFPADSSDCRLQMNSYQLRHGLHEHLFPVQLTTASQLPWTWTTANASVFGTRPYWEQDGLGYRREGSAVAILGRAAVTPPLEIIDPKSLCAAFEHIQSMISKTASTVNELCWADIDLHNMVEVMRNDDSNVSSSTDRPVKRRCKENSEKTAFDIKDVDRQLSLLFDSLPSNALLVVFSQESMVALKKLIAKKLRLKWDMSVNSMTGKRKAGIAWLFRDRRAGKLGE
jgi:hypothetical protein